jgi:SAM-dependent methyltransferase
MTRQLVDGSSGPAPLFRMSYQTTIGAQPLPPATPSRWSADTITDKTYRDKFVWVPGKLAEWLAAHGGLDGKEVLDFGCGEATTALSLALRFPRARVTGVEIGPDIDRCLPLAREQLGLSALPPNLALHLIQPGELPDPQVRFDLIYSWSAFEHVDQPLLPAVLRQLRDALKPGGKLFIQIQPLYYSSDGGHLMYKVPERWGHLLNQANRYDEKLSAACRDAAEYRALTSMFSTLNRITAPHLFALVGAAGLRILRRFTSREDYPIPEPLLHVYTEAALRTDGVEVLAEPD